MKTNERINQGIKKFENEDKNINKILSYISKINQNTKTINKLLREHMKSIKFSYKEEEADIKYEEYFLNGSFIPKDIEFNNIDFNSLNLSWKIDNINNIDKNKIKFKVEKRKEKEEFNQEYEGKDQYCLINNLEFGNNYEFRICSIYNDIIGDWSEIKKITIIDLDSNILKETKRKKEFVQKMLEWCGYKNMKLIYRVSRDGMTSNAFHNKCDNQGPTIVLYKSEKSIFGGFTSISWTSDGNYHYSPDCFLFTLINIHKTEPTKFPISGSCYSIFDDSNYGPTFGVGHDIKICKNDIHTNFPSSYKDILGKGKSVFTGDLDNNNNSFKLKEIEVFKIFK